ncbi:L,D-transpeptidase family protein [Prevotella sp. 10(H)]|uniref:L,D-transpeptidase family protein n=1 Tax=Prevotella sp. 10(H) TaxID=1158294 RepID=UPI0004A6F418|nr:L,D-transpeptidase family protein [Prevotella sp. 10(H)]
MKYILRISFLLILCFSIVCCKKKEHTKVSESGKKEVVRSKFAKNYPEFDSKILRESLMNKVSLDSALNHMYTVTEYNPVWIHDTLDTKRLYKFIDILSHAEDHGLSTELFSTADIKSMTDAIDSGMYINNLDTVYKIILDLEQTSTRSAIKYITGMKYGFVNPKDLYKKNYDITLAKPDSVFYTELYKELKKDPIAALLNSQPQEEVYLKLQEEYKSLVNKKEKGFQEIASGEATYKLGDKSKHIKTIADRLMLTGEYAPDSLSNDSLHEKLDEKLLAAINAFRKKNSYPEEKEVGKLTVTALNRPFDYYMAKIRVNMERYRWRRTKKKHNKHIEVNVASFMLVATDANSDTLPLISRVCVGSVRNKTPLLQSDISYMNLNPYWNVPTSIAQKEVAVLQKRDPTYIKRNNMKLYKGGKEVDVSSIDWKEVTPSKFHYIVKQNPGAGNSLGLVKFMFNNAFSVYLHDTPSKAAFNRKNRAVSHGCVRVQRPFDLAFFCSSPVEEAYKDQFYYSINKPPVSEEGKKLLKANKLKKLPDIINIDKDNPISLFIDYYTAYMFPEDQNLYYADDIYDYDGLILDALNPQNI